MPLPANYPTSLDALANPTSSTYTDDPGFELDEVISRIHDILEALEAKAGIGATTPARGRQLIGGATGSVWDAVARKNLLVNGSGAVWQRGTPPVPTPADNQYGPDRWRLLLEAANAAAITKETADLPTASPPSGFTLTVGSGEDNKFGIFQCLEHADVRHLRGQQLSLQAAIKATAAIGDVRMAVLEWTGTADAVAGDSISSWGSAGTNPTLAAGWAYLGVPANLNPTTSWATYRSEGLTVGASANNLGVLIWCEDESTTVTTDVLRITDVQLEEGAVCTGVERRPYAFDLALCQSWLRVHGGGNVRENVAAGQAVSTTAARMPIPLSPPMRAAPTGSVSAAADWSVTDAAGLVVACTAVSFGFETPRNIFCLATVASGLVAGSATRIEASSTSNARMYFSAEL